MLYKIDYTTRNNKRTGTAWIDFVPDETAAVKEFMDSFFANNPDDAVRIDLVTNVEIVGDASAIQIGEHHKEDGRG